METKAAQQHPCIDLTLVEKTCSIYIDAIPSGHELHNMFLKVFLKCVWHWTPLSTDLLCLLFRNILECQTHLNVQKIHLRYRHVKLGCFNGKIS